MLYINFSTHGQKFHHLFSFFINFILFFIFVLILAHGLFLPNKYNRCCVPPPHPLPERLLLLPYPAEKILGLWPSQGISPDQDSFLFISPYEYILLFALKKKNTFASGSSALYVHLCSMPAHLKYF